MIHKILAHSFCKFPQNMILPICFISSIHTHHTQVHMVFLNSTLKPKCVFHRKKSILLHNQNTVIKIRILTLIQYYYLKYRAYSNLTILLIFFMVNGKRSLFLDLFLLSHLLCCAYISFHNIQKSELANYNQFFLERNHMDAVNVQ